MRRRLTAATVGMVVAALLLVGVGTTVLTAVNARPTPKPICAKRSNR